MVQEHTQGYHDMQAFMRGWKHGSGANAQIQTSGPYADGYQAGVIARVKAQKEAQKKYKVTNDEVMRGVLR